MIVKPLFQVKTNHYITKKYNIMLIANADCSLARDGIIASLVTLRSYTQEWHKISFGVFDCHKQASYHSLHLERKNS